MPELAPDTKSPARLTGAGLRAIAASPAASVKVMARRITPRVPPFSPKRNTPIDLSFFVPVVFNAAQGRLSIFFVKKRRIGRTRVSSFAQAVAGLVTRMTRSACLAQAPRRRAVSHGSSGFVLIRVNWWLIPGQGCDVEPHGWAVQPGNSGTQAQSYPARPQGWTAKRQDCAAKRLTVAAQVHDCALQVQPAIDQLISLPAVLAPRAIHCRSSFSRNIKNLFSIPTGVSPDCPGLFQGVGVGLGVWLGLGVGVAVGETVGRGLGV